MRDTLLWTAAAVLSLAVAGTAYGQVGALTQLAGQAGCVSEDGTGGACVDGTALLSPFSVVLSPDGKYLYAVTANSNAVVAFSRNKQTGVVTQLAGQTGCVSDDGTGGACTDGTALDDPLFLTVSPDGRHLYVASFFSGAVAVFARDKKTGALAQLPGQAGCVSETGSGGACADGTALFGPDSVAVTPDGKHVYVAAGNSDAVAAFARDKKTGVLTQLAGQAGCVSEGGSGGACSDGKALNTPTSLAVTPDGKHVYVAALNGNAVASFARNKKTGALTQLAGQAGCVSEDGSGGACADGKALVRAIFVAVSKDGKHVYVKSQASNAVAVFARDKKTGALTQLAGLAGCVSEDGSGGACTDGVALMDQGSLSLSSDGKNLYVASENSSAVAVFARDKKTGALTQLAGLTGCVSDDGNGGTCADGRALSGAYSVALSKDGKFVYVVSRNGNAVAVFARTKK